MCYFMRLAGKGVGVESGLFGKQTRNLFQSTAKILYALDVIIDELPRYCSKVLNFCENQLDI